MHPGNVFVNREGNQFLMFDLGIATEYSDHDHEVIVDILSAFIQREGFLAGERMMDDTHYHNKTVKNGEKFCRKMAILTDRASGKEYFMQHLGDYISYICKAAADHHIRINPAFISMALAIKVQEGIALALDPTVKIIKVATPIIVESESRRRLQMRWKNVEDWAKQLSESLFGEKETTSSDSDR